MVVLKCKMCGGNLQVTESQNIGTCDSCGSTMTLPNNNDERILNLFDRANHYRLQNEFDKALATYESILAEDNNNAEAHWGCVLSKFGIEYVEDPKTHKRVPTCHRVRNESILSDLDYKNALENAEDIQSQDIYKEQAEAIATIQKGILEIANKEEAYDVFICYKETDNNGKRTVDSTIAQDIYYQLVNEGFKVFFSRITLEDKLGNEYEPYIFAALNSAKVMLVVGTNKEYFNATWVKNEWARFLDMSKKDRSKIIIPCYRDMDAYDLPDELSLFQSQDMSKIGFIQDLIRGIKKIVIQAEPKANTIVLNNNEKNVDTLLKRAFLLLEEANWNGADNLLEEVLNYDPEKAEAYLGKLMIEIKVNKKENIENRAIDFSSSNNYQKAIRFSDKNLKSELEEYCNKAKIKYDELRAKQEENEKLFSEKYQVSYSKLKQTDIDSKIHKLDISIIIGAIISFIGYIIMNWNLDIAMFAFLLGFGCIFISPIIIICYSKYHSAIDKKKAEMILFEEKMGKKTLNEDVKRIFETFINDEKIKYKGHIGVFEAKKMFRDESQNNLGDFVMLLNSYKPKIIKEDIETRKKRKRKILKKYGIMFIIAIILLGSYFIIDNVITEKEREKQRREYEEAQVYVPDVRGKTVAEAKEILDQLDINYEFSTSNPGVNGKNYASTEPDAIVKYQKTNTTSYLDGDKGKTIDKRTDKIKLTALTQDMINHTGEYYIPSNNSKYNSSYYYGY